MYVCEIEKSERECVCMKENKNANTPPPLLFCFGKQDEEFVKVLESVASVVQALDGEEIVGPLLVSKSGFFGFGFCH